LKMSIDIVLKQLRFQGKVSGVSERRDLAAN
jgi:hypothetical protein